MQAQTHPRQTERLQALDSYEILDTAPERAFDEVVQLVAAICEVPIALIGLLDDRRHWFKARLGTDLTEAPVEMSFCAHAILQDDFVEIGDTRTDPRTRDNPLVLADPNLRFYAGAQLRTETGLPIGTLCIFDTRPRQLTPLQRDTIRVMAGQVMARLDLRRALRLGETLRREVDHRVKNSLQSLVSLTRIQARAAKGEEAREALQSIERRIGAVSMLHEQLYRTGSGADVDLAAYALAIRDSLTRIAPQGVAVVLTAQTVRVASQEAVAIGTLMNEFAANAFKHAFPDGRRGGVAFDIRALPGGRVAVSCTDDGVGLDGAAPPATGLGMQVAEAICLQLGCTLQMRTGPGGTGLALSVEFEPAQAA